MKAGASVPFRLAEHLIAGSSRMTPQVGRRSGIKPVFRVIPVHSRSIPRCPRSRVKAVFPRRTYASHATSDHRSASSSSAPNILPKDTFDIIIIGGGNAGLALTCALLAKPTIQATSRILLLEGGNLDRVRRWAGEEEWDNRVSSLTAENVAWLERGIGVWDHIEQSRSCPVHEMIVRPILQAFEAILTITSHQVWANPTPLSTPSIHFPPLDHPMAHVTENINLQRALLRRIEAAGQGVVEIREGSKVEEMQLGEGEQSIGLRVGEDQWVRGAVVVGADGPNSPVRRFSTIGSYGHAYPTHAVVATLLHEAPLLYPNNTAFQRFLPTGPLAFLPLSPEASTMVWSTKPDLAAAYKRLTPEALTRMVNAGYSVQEDVLASLNERILQGPLTAQEITSFLASATPDTPYSSEQPILPPVVTSIPPKSIASFPLRLSHADSYLGNRAVLVGDAAHTIHPLAGQGLNMGLADVRSLADVWESVRHTGGDLGARTSLLDYSKHRYSANQLMLTTTDTLHHLFGSRNVAVNWLRGTGMDVMNELGPIKKGLMGGAGAGAGLRTDDYKELERGGVQRARGWGVTAASTLEGWLGFKRIVGFGAGLAGEAAKNGLRRVAGAVERR